MFKIFQVNSVYKRVSAVDNDPGACRSFCFSVISILKDNSIMLYVHYFSMGWNVSYSHFCGCIDYTDVPTLFGFFVFLVNTFFGLSNIAFKGENIVSAFFTAKFWNQIMKYLIAFQIATLRTLIKRVWRAFYHFTTNCYILCCQRLGAQFG